MGRENRNLLSSRGGERGVTGSRVGEQLCPVVPHTSSPSTHQSGPGKKTGNRRDRCPPSTALQLRHRGLRSGVRGILPAHTAWLTPTGPPPHSTLTLYPSAAAQSLPTKHSQAVPMAGICSSPETCLAEGQAGRCTSRVLETLPFLHCHPHPHPEPFWDPFP